MLLLAAAWSEDEETEYEYDYDYDYDEDNGEEDDLMVDYNNLIIQLYNLKSDLLQYFENLTAEEKLYEYDEYEGYDYDAYEYYQDNVSKLVGCRENTSKLCEWSFVAEDMTNRHIIATLLNNDYSWTGPTELGSEIEDILIDCKNGGKPCKTSKYSEGYVKTEVWPTLCLHAI